MLIRLLSALMVAAALTGFASSAQAVEPQALLLEASDDGSNVAIPFSGTVHWKQGLDNSSLPTLEGDAEIPARGLHVHVVLRKNVEASLPASHLMEVTFTTSADFIGGAIAGLPGVLLKDEELVQGVPLIGASARVVTNTFLFAMSASADDAKRNLQLLGSRRWLDIAIIYATGKRAIVTMEKDAAAQAMFRNVLSAWDGTDSQPDPRKPRQPRPLR